MVAAFVSQPSVRRTKFLDTCRIRYSVLTGPDLKSCIQFGILPWELRGLNEHSLAVFTTLQEGPPDELELVYIDVLPEGLSDFQDPLFPSILEGNSPLRVWFVATPPKWREDYIKSDQPLLWLQLQNG